MERRDTESLEDVEPLEDTESLRDSEYALPTPRVNAVGIIELPDGYAQSETRHSPSIRRMAWLFLVLFASVTLTTSILSLGAYCLTSDGGDGRALRQATATSAAEP